MHQPREKQHGPKKLDFYFRVPFFRNNTNEFFSREIKSILGKYFPQMKSTPVFYNNYRIKSFTNHKEKVLPPSESGLVYKYSCPICQQAYVGSTKKTLLSRIHEHKGISLRTGRPLSSPLFSSIRQHLERCDDSSINTEDFEILYRGKSETDIRIAESMLIKKLNPELNNETSCFQLRFWVWASPPLTLF